MAEWLRRLADGIELEIRVTPRAGRTALAGTMRDAAGRTRLAVRLAAPPAEGAANAALLRLLAEALQVPKSACQLVVGETARIKRVRISGDPEALAARLQTVMSEVGP